MQRSAIFLNIFFLFLGIVTAHAQQSEAVDLKRKGDALRQAGSPTQAEAAYRKAIATDPNYLDAYSSLSAHYLEQQKFSSAITLLHQALQRDPNYAEGWYNLGFAYRKQGQIKKAIEAYRRFIDLNPQNPDAHFALGLALKAQGDYEGAVTSFKQYAQLEKNPEKEQWVKRALELAEELERNSQNKRVTPPQASAFSADSNTHNNSNNPSTTPPSSSKTATNQLNLHASRSASSSLSSPSNSKDIDHSSSPPIIEPSKIKPAVLANANEPEAGTPERKQAQKYKKEGDRLVRAGRREAAVEQYKKALAIDFSYAAAANELGVTLSALHRYDEAIQIFRIAVRDNPSYHLGWYNLAYVLRQAKRLPEAVSAYRKFIQLKPRDPDPHYGLAQTWEELGNKKEAIQSLKDYIQLEKRPNKAQRLHLAQVTLARLEGRPMPPTKTKAQSPTFVAPQSSTPLARKPLIAHPPLTQEKSGLKPNGISAKAIPPPHQGVTSKKQASIPENTSVPKTVTASKGGALTPNPKVKNIATGSGTKQPVPVHTEIPMADTIIGPPVPLFPNSHPSTASAKLRAQADRLARNRQCHAAASLYRQAVGIDPFDTRAYDGLAYCAFQLGAHTQGLAMLTVGLRDNPDYHQGWKHMARLQRAAGEKERAVGSYIKYLRVKPTDAEGHFELARTLKSIGRKEQAIAAYNDFFKNETHAKNRAMKIAASQELKALGGTPPALSSSKPSPKPEPVTTASSGKAKNEPAVHSDILLRTMGIKSHPPTLPNSIAVSMDQKAAISNTTETEKPKTPAELRAEARRKKAEERKAKAEEKRRLAEEKRQQAEEKRRAKAEAKKAALAEKQRAAQAALAPTAIVPAKQISKAKESSELMLSTTILDPWDQKIQSNTEKSPLGLATNISKDFNAVTTDGESATTIPTDRPQPAPEVARRLVSIADEQFAKKRFDIALGIFQQAVKLHSNSTVILYKAGLAALAMRQLPLAVEYFGRVVKLDPKNKMALINLKMATGATETSTLNPTAMTKALNKIRAQLKSRKYQTAVEQLDKLIVQDGSSSKLYLLRAEARLALRQFEKAVQDGARALAFNPDLTEAMRIMGDAHRQLKQQNRALYYYRLYLTKVSPKTGPKNSKRLLVEKAITELAKQTN